MAYMSQERKKEIHNVLKTIIPKTWKWSTAVRHHSTIILTISQAPILATNTSNSIAYSYADVIADQSIVAIFDKIYAAMHNGNHDRSDAMCDYFDVGWYVDIQLGKWDKPFIYTGGQPIVKAEEPTTTTDTHIFKYEDGKLSAIPVN